MAETTRPVVVTNCLDCGTPVDRRFCPQCGQKVGPRQRPFWSMLIEFFAESFALDGRFFRSLGPLLFKPGTLTREYNAGRRTRYVSPFRLYLLSAFVLFFSATVQSWATSFSPPSEHGDSRNVTISPGSEADLVRVEEYFDRHPFVMKITARARKLNADPDFQDQIEHAWTGTIPTTLFLLLPIFAFLAWSALAGHRFYFAEAFSFSLHVYAFTYLFLVTLKPFEFAFGENVRWAIGAIPIYFVVAFARAFGLVWYSAILRSFALAGVFLPIFTVALLASFLFAFGTS